MQQAVHGGPHEDHTRTTTLSGRCRTAADDRAADAVVANCFGRLSPLGQPLLLLLLLLLFTHKGVLLYWCAGSISNTL